MAAIAYYIAIPFIYLISLLPFGVMYLFSDGIYLLLYYVVGYRKKITIQNLENAFPEKTKQEIEKIAKEYCAFLCDLFLETFKTLTISKKSMLRHCVMNTDAINLFAKYAAEKKNILLVMGHLGNWEWAGNTFSLTCNQQLYVIYHPISNKYFDRFTYSMRTRFGTKLIAMKNAYRAMLAQKNELTVTAFIADQTPSSKEAYWTTFLNQDTPVFRGTEVIAKKLDYPVVYARAKKIKRGYYEISAETLIEHSRDTKEDEISELHTKKLEADIIAEPANWLWSHRRWKHTRNVK